MNIVTNITRLGGSVQGFQGSTVDEAIQRAEAWAKRNGRKLVGNIYKQVKLGKSESIIVDVEEIKEEETPIETLN